MCEKDAEEIVGNFQVVFASENIVAGSQFDTAIT
jgi:hypothetical protein